MGESWYATVLETHPSLFAPGNDAKCQLLVVPRGDMGDQNRIALREILDAYLLAKLDMMGECSREGFKLSIINLVKLLETSLSRGASDARRDVIIKDCHRFVHNQNCFFERGLFTIKVKRRDTSFFIVADDTAAPAAVQRHKPALLPTTHTHTRHTHTRTSVVP